MNIIITIKICAAMSYRIDYIMCFSELNNCSYHSGVGSNKKVGGHTNWQDEWVGPKAAARGN